MARIAVLCGTGMSALASEMSDSSDFKISRVRIDTDWGSVPSSIVSTEFGDILVIDRHHSDGKLRTPPHKIEHRANVQAIVNSNPDIVMSINSVGSMIENFPPGTIGISSDVLDLAVRPWTFHDDDAKHADRTSPFDSPASKICRKALESTQVQTPSGLIIAQCVGPQFESPAEIDALEKLGAHAVGMTLGPESRLMSETGIRHVALACSSNWAAGREPGDPSAMIDHHAVDSMASSMRGSVTNCLLAILKSIN
tara:strand:+ start:15248 stop:16009 length:762 start_codon:yes stop_codon:yes gene_type:complete